MSAFICSPVTFGVVAKTLKDRCPELVEDYTVTELVRALVLENAKSVGFRYNCTPGEAVKDFTGKTIKRLVQESITVAVSDIVEQVELGRVWGAVACYTYQTCEHIEDDKPNEVYKAVAQYESYLESLCKSKRTQRKGWDF